MVITSNVAGDNSENKKRSRGKQKINLMKKIEDENSRNVAFSKRRSGLFKKAAEICVLTGAQVAILVTSPAGRQVYAFRHPNSDFLFDHFHQNINNNNDQITTTKNSPLPLPLMELNQHYMAVSKELEAEKKRGGTIIPASSNGGSRWYEEAVHGMDVEELEEYLSSLEELKKKVLVRADELMMINNSSSFFGFNYLVNKIDEVLN